jgi:hypothetical protein
VIISYVIFFSVLRIGTRALCMVGKHFLLKMFQNKNYIYIL